MDQNIDLKNQPKGNWTLNLNFKRNSNPKAPAITGKISTPENPDKEYSYEAYKHFDKDGKPYFIGPVKSDSLRGALAKTDGELTNENFVAIRFTDKVFSELENGAPNPAYETLSAEDKEKEDAKPTFWCSWTRTEGQPQLNGSAWDRAPTRYGPWASGSIQHKLTKEQVQAAKAAEETHGMASEPTRSRRGRRDLEADQDMSR